jgi:hypothetical protein
MHAISYDYSTMNVYGCIIESDSHDSTYSKAMTSVSDLQSLDESISTDTASPDEEVSSTVSTESSDFDNQDDDYDNTDADLFDYLVYAIAVLVSVVISLVPL